MRQKADNQWPPIVATIQEGVTLEGKLKATVGTVRIAGRLVGDIEAEDTVIVDHDGACQSSIIRAPRVIVLGKVKGNIQAMDRIEVGQNGEILGGVVASPILIVKAGGVVEGEVRTAT